MCVRTRIKLHVLSTHRYNAVFKLLVYCMCKYVCIVHTANLTAYDK